MMPYRRTLLRLLPAAAAGGALAGLRPGLARAASGVANRNTLTGSHIVGYQGWFGCPGDPVPQPGWVHWFGRDKQNRPVPSVDMLPDTSELSAGELCTTPWKDAAGQPITLFSSARAPTVERHFSWMQQYGIDGAALQRFVSELAIPPLKARRDRVLELVRQAAETHGRSFYITYDITGASVAQLKLLLDDWRALTAAGITRSTAYQHHRGRPVLQIWGMGIGAKDPGSAEQLSSMLLQLRAITPITVVGGVGSNWRQQAAAPGWAQLFRSLEVISPWSVSLYHDPASADAYMRTVIVPDLAETKRNGQDYQPVIFPGFSWGNLGAMRGQPGKYNSIPRDCGRFYWLQARNAAQAGCTMLYTAMFDEVDEGTAIFKLAPTKDLPTTQRFVGDDADGCVVPSDWYLRIAGQITNSLHTHRWPATLPLKIPTQAVPAPAVPTPAAPTQPAPRQAAPSQAVPSQAVPQ